MRYVFADCTLDTDLYALQRVDRPALLRAKVFQVLHYLLTHRDRVVSKQELCEQVWAGQFISDAAVEAVVKAVRQAVGDTGRRQWCIQTRRGHGYRFVAPVTALSPIPAAGPDVIASGVGATLASPGGGARRRAGSAPGVVDGGTAGHAPGGLRRRRDRHRQDGGGGGLRGRPRPGRGRLDRPRAVRRAVRDGRGLPPAPGSPGAPLPRSGGCRADRAAAATRAELAGADAGAAASGRARGAPAPGQRGDAGADAARARGSDGASDRRAAAGLGAGRSPLERCLDPRVARVCRAPARSGTAARAGDASTGGNARPSASVARDHPGASAARSLSRPGAARSTAGRGGPLSRSTVRRRITPRTSWRRSSTGAPTATRSSWSAWWTTWRERDWERESRRGPRGFRKACAS